VSFRDDAKDHIASAKEAGISSSFLIDPRDFFNQKHGFLSHMDIPRTPELDRRLAALPHEVVLVKTELFSVFERVH
jgi:hypothetical protein